MSEEKINCEECNEDIIEPSNICKSCFMALARNYGDMNRLNSKLLKDNIELKDEVSNLKDMISQYSLSLKRMNGKCVKYREALISICIDIFVADYQSELTRVNKLAREALKDE